MGWITLALQALAEGLKLWAAQKQIELRRLAIDEQEKLENEMDELQAQIDNAFEKARSTGNTADLRLVDRMRQRLEQRQQLAAFVATRIPSSSQGPVDPNKGGDLPAPNK